MARDYQMIHFIQERMSGLDDKLASIVVRMFNRLESRQLYASALSTSITLFLAFKSIGCSPKLILGTVQFQGLSYPHAWLELNDKIFDLATYEDIRRHPVLKERDLKPIKPQINISYEDASEEICYYPFQFGETWQLASMRALVGKTFDKYIEESQNLNIMADACYVLNKSEIPKNVNLLKDLAKLELIQDFDKDAEIDIDKLQ